MQRAYSLNFVPKYVGHYEEGMFSMARETSLDTNVIY